MTKEAFKISNDFMTYQGFDRYPTLLHTIDFKKLHEKVCTAKGVKREIAVSNPYIKAVLWSLFLNHVVDPITRNKLLSTKSMHDISLETGISKRQIGEILKAILFMGLIEIHSINSDTSKRYRLNFTELTTDEIKSILD